MVKLLRLGDKAINTLNQLKEILDKGEYCKELVKSINTGELMTFFESWKQEDLKSLLMEEGSEVEKLNRLCKKLIGRDGVYREESIERLSIARGVEEILDVMGNGGEIDLTVGDYRLNIDRIELRGVARIIGDGRGRSNIVLMGDKLEITGTGGSKVSMSNLTIRSNGDCESRITINGVEAEFENINFVRVGLKVKNGGKISITRAHLINSIVAR